MNWILLKRKILFYSVFRGTDSHLILFNGISFKSIGLETGMATWHWKSFQWKILWNMKTHEICEKPILLGTEWKSILKWKTEFPLSQRIVPEHKQTPFNLAHPWKKRLLYFTFGINFDSMPNRMVSKVIVKQIENYFIFIKYIFSVIPFPLFLNRLVLLKGFSSHLILYWEGERLLLFDVISEISSYMLSPANSNQWAQSSGTYITQWPTVQTTIQKQRITDQKKFYTSSPSIICIDRIYSVLLGLAYETSEYCHKRSQLGDPRLQPSPPVIARLENLFYLLLYHLIRDNYDYQYLQ